MRKSKGRKRRSRPLETKNAKTTPCTVQIIEEFGAEWLEPLPPGGLTRRAKQEHDAIIALGVGGLRTTPQAPSLRPQRSNPDCRRGKILDCFAPLAMTTWRQRSDLIRREPREPEIAVVRAASQRLCPVQADASRCIGVEIKPTNVRQDFLVSMASREFAKAASLVVDAEFKVVTRARLDEVVDEIFRKLSLMVLCNAFCRLLAQQGLVL